MIVWGLAVGFSLYSDSNTHIHKNNENRNITITISNNRNSCNSNNDNNISGNCDGNYIHHNNDSNENNKAQNHKKNAKDADDAHEQVASESSIRSFRHLGMNALGLGMSALQWAISFEGFGSKCCRIRVGA